MSLLPEDPFKHLSHVRREFDRMFSTVPFYLNFFDNMFSNFGGMNVSLNETATEVIANCDIPGLKKDDDIQIHVDQNMLMIKGSVNKTTEIKKEDMYRQESFAGGFYRSVLLPCPVSKDGVKATYRDGVLEIRMLKTNENNIRNIEIDFY